MPMDGGFINGNGNSMTKATAEGRLYNHSPRLACLPGVSCGRINLPPKSGCINHGIYFSKLSHPSRHRWWRTSGTRDGKDALCVPGYGKVPSLRDDVDVAMVLGISTTALRRFSLGIACFVGKNTYLCLEKELNDEL